MNAGGDRTGVPVAWRWLAPLLAVAIGTMPAAAQPGAALQAAPDGVLAWTEAPRHDPGEEVVVRFEGMPGHAGDWITVIAADEPDDRYAAWAYTGGLTSGQLTFDGLPAGDYEVRAYFDWPHGGYEVRSRHAFVVGSAGPAAMPSPTAPPPLPPSAGSGPAQRVEHASGAVLVAPDGTLPAGHGFRFETVADPPSAEPFAHLAPALVVRSDGAPLPARAIELTLPAPSAHAAVMVHSLGEWVRVPAEPVTLAGGARGLAVRIDRLPLPWLVTVVDVPVEARGASGLAGGSGPYATLARLEQLRITDPDGMAAEFERLDALVQQRSPLLHVSTAQDRDAYGLLLDARLAFLRAYDASRRPGGRFSPRAAEHYADGLELLDAAAERIMWTPNDEREARFTDRAGLDARAEGLVREHVYGGRLTLADALHYYIGTFVPWGFGITHAVILGEDRALGRQFDVRVLPFYGMEPFTNLVVPGRFDAEALLAHAEHQPPAMARGLREVTRELRTVNRQANAIVTLRLYSPRILEWTTDDVYRFAKSAAGGASWLYGAASLVATASAGALTTIPAGAAVVTAYGLVAPLVESMFIEPRADRWAAEGFVSKTVSLSAYSAGKLVGTVVLDAGSRGFGALPEVADLVLAAVIDYDALARVDELRGLGTRGVPNPAAWFFQDQFFYSPPVEVVFNVAGPTTLRAHADDADRAAHWPSTFESYLVGGHGNFSVFVDHDAINLWYLQEGVRFDPMVPYPGTLFGLPLHTTPFRARSSDPTTAWASMYHVDEAPHAQVLRWTLNASTLEAWAKALRLESVDELLDRVAIEVRSIHGERAYRVYRHRADTGATDAVEADRATLARAARPRDDTGDARAFAVAVLESEDATPRPLHEHVGITLWNERSVGEWSQLMLYTPDQRHGQFELEYEVRLVAGREEMLRFPVAFASRAAASTNVLVTPTGDLANLPLRKIEVSTVRPDVAHEFRIDARSLEQEATHSTYELAVLDRASTDLSGLRFSWSVASQHGDAIAIGEQQGRASVTLELPFDPRDHHPDPNAPPPGSSPFAVHVPATVYTVRVEISRDGRFVDRVERQVGVSGPYVVRIDQFGRD